MERLRPLLARGYAGFTETAAAAERWREPPTGRITVILNVGEPFGGLLDGFPAGAGGGRAAPRASRRRPSWPRGPGTRFSRTPARPFPNLPAMGDRQNVIPVLVYEDIEAAQDFLVRAFGFEGGLLHREDGRVVHGEVSIGGTTLWLHRVTAEHGLASPKSLPATSGGLVVLVDDVDEHYRRAAEAGAKIEYPPADMPYGQREYGARDPEETHWNFATRIE
jgi:uncharacterized glyoxalase superfamily protein PhnB